MGVELSDLRCFTAVSEALHFGQAAAKLGYTPSNVSYRIRRLEHELGTTLFRRTSRRVALTVQGERLLRSAQAVLQAVDELHRRAAEIQGNVQRTLAISYTPYTNDIAADLIREYRALRPDVLVSAALLSGQDLEKSVIDGDCEAGITVWASPRLKALPFGPPVTVSLLVPQGHRLEVQSSVEIADLTDEPLLIVAREQEPEAHDLIVAFYGQHGVRPDFQPRVVTSTEQAIDFVATGQGVCHVLSSFRAPTGTTMIPVVGPLPPIHGRYLVWDRRRRSPLLHDLIAVARTLREPPLS